MRYVGRGSDLVVKLCEPNRIGVRAFWEELQCNLLPEPEIIGAIHLPMPPLPRRLMMRYRPAGEERRARNGRD